MTQIKHLHQSVIFHIFNLSKQHFKRKLHSFIPHSSETFLTEYKLLMAPLKNNSECVGHGADKQMSNFTAMDLNISIYTEI